MKLIHVGNTFCIPFSAMNRDAQPSPMDAQDSADIIAGMAAAELAAADALPSDDATDPERLRRTVATRAEMIAQPSVISRNWELSRDRLAEVADRIVGVGITRALLVGAGDSLAVMSAARFALERMLGVPCDAVQSAELAFYPPPRLSSDTLVIALSSSGETTRTVAAMLAGSRAGALTVAMTNHPTSSIAGLSDSTVLVEATRVGWPTQSSTAALALLLRLACEVGARLGTAGSALLSEELDGIPDLMARTIATADPAMRGIAESEATAKMYNFTGAGPSWGAAVVGAAKVKECSPDHAIAVQLEEFHHYNSVKGGEPVWMFCPAGPTVPRAADTILEAARLGGHVHVVTSESVSSLHAGAASVLQLPDTDEALSPLLTFLPAQLVGYHLAMAKFAAAGVSLD